MAPPNPQQEPTPRSAALPAFCTPHILLITLLLGFCLALLLAIAPGASEDRWVRLGTTAWFTTWVALITVSLLCALRRPLSRLRLTPLLLGVMSTLLAVTAAVSLFAYQSLTELGWQATESQAEFLLHNLAIAAVVGAVGIWIFSLHLAKARQLSAQTKAELDALHARIRPHFLFNSLNTVAALIDTDPKAAETAVLNLASIFRAALNAADTALLAEELELARRYLVLEQWRLGSRLSFEEHLPAEDLPKIRLPVLTLQPLLENAVRHSAERSTAPCTVRLECQVSPRSVSIVIDNPRVAGETASNGNGISQANIQDRLALMFGDAASLRAGVVDDRYRVKLVIPRPDRPQDTPERHG
ncbi:hypothetical protein A9404_09235 [Halothiobacillus diazotrophicus]|uniref:Signal transduction histidine kinase internal region domain-containing protein n=2 Tax=Halothiobacillus diazotrophicus TaxID=1860122 RepID=A0A191ZKL9_9GAMM|nr:hypothetical protein A9404_09235 [Halothiobacillus diazotrophicus]